MNYSKKVLKNHRYSQCHVLLFDDGTISFYSYRTLVIEISADKFMMCTGTYSQTTRRQIGWFLREYAPSLNYYDAKFCYEHNCRMSVETGEIDDRTWEEVCNG